jgi:plasmid stabilization system protein ParE
VTRPVQWSRHALDDLKRQIAYIAADNPGAARRIADRIRETVDGGENPRINGAVAPEAA